MHHWFNVVWSASSNYLNQFRVIAHYTPRNKPPWKWKLNQDISSSSLSAAYRHIYVSEIANENMLIGFYFIAKHQFQKTKKMGVNIFHSAAKY